jgi:hypothetical protein
MKPRLRLYATHQPPPPAPASGSLYPYLAPARWPLSSVSLRRRPFPSGRSPLTPRRRPSQRVVATTGSSTSPPPPWGKIRRPRGLFLHLGAMAATITAVVPRRAREDHRATGHGTTRFRPQGAVLVPGRRHDDTVGHGTTGCRAPAVPCLAVPVSCWTGRPVWPSRARSYHAGHGGPATAHYARTRRWPLCQRHSLPPRRTPATSCNCAKSLHLHLWQPAHSGDALYWMLVTPIEERS